MIFKPAHYLCLVNFAVKNISITELCYHLPEDRIAKFPLVQRDLSKLLVYKNNEIRETIFQKINEVLPENALLVFNNTKVIHARLLFQKETGANIEIFCLEPLNADYAQVFASYKSVEWKCLVGNAKRWKNEALKKEVVLNGKIVELFAEKQSQNDDTFVIKLSWNDERFSFAEILDAAGVLPIPPYLNREADAKDEQTYQTIYAKQNGSVAAPTAGLHFTDEVLKTLSEKQISTTELTLHVGAGTFKPIKAETLAQHTMHEETVSVPLVALEKIHTQLASGNKIIAVGTTSTRTLESLYWHGVKLLQESENSTMSVKQWEAYELDATNISASTAIRAIIENLKENNLDTLQGSTQIIIAPSYQFKIVDILITNFHQPENSLILLIAAFVGNDWRKIYDYALNNNFRFLSYGDSSVLFR